MDDWQEHAAKAIRREVTADPRIPIRGDVLYDVVAREYGRLVAINAELTDLLDRIPATVRALQYLPGSREVTAREDAYNKGVQDLADAISSARLADVREPVA